MTFHQITLYKQKNLKYTTNMNPLSLNTATPVDLEADLAAPSLTPYQRQWQLKQYQRLINLIPHGKHAKQRGTKGAFGNRKSNRAK